MKITEKTVFVVDGRDFPSEEDAKRHVALVKVNNLLAETALLPDGIELLCQWLLLKTAPNKNENFERLISALNELY